MENLIVWSIICVLAVSGTIFLIIAWFTDKCDSKTRPLVLIFAFGIIGLAIFLIFSDVYYKSSLPKIVNQTTNIIGDKQKVQSELLVNNQTIASLIDTIDLKEVQVIVKSHEDSLHRIQKEYVKSHNLKFSFINYLFQSH